MKYVVDTNVIIYNELFHQEFLKSDEFIILPAVLDELDTLKTKHYTIRGFFDQLFKAKPGKFHIPPYRNPDLSVDNQIIEYAKENEGVLVLSNDTLVLINARNEGIQIKKYTPKPPKAVDFSHVEPVPPVWGLSPKNAEQNAAISAILDLSKHLVALSGPAGCGKTIVAIAAILELLNKNIVEKIYISRPVIPLGSQDIGFLPGSQDEKLHPWIQPIIDNIKALSPPQKNKKNNSGASVDYLFETGKIEVMALSFIRGRSLRNCIVFVDEIQNLSRHEIKTLLTRVGDNCKIIVTGDMEQVDINNSGYQFMIKQFQDSDIFAHIKLTESVRSQLAKEAGERL